MKILSIESSCDETAAAVVEDGRRVLSNVVASQVEEHKLYGGVVPEIASRRHSEAISGVVRRALEESYDEGIVIGAMCIAPTVIARVLGKHHIKLTIGNDTKVAAGLKKMGAEHENKAATEVCVDEEHKIVTTPCYMLANSINQVAEGTHNLVEAVLDLI